MTLCNCQSMYIRLGALLAIANFQQYLPSTGYLISRFNRTGQVGKAQLGQPVYNGPINLYRLSFLSTRVQYIFLPSEPRCRYVCH